MTLRKITLDRIEEYLNAETLSIAKVCYFMQQIRILFEIDQDWKKYPIARLYCDWLLHSELNRNNTGFEIVEKLADIFSTIRDSNQLIKEVSKSISIQELITQLRDILWSKIEDKNKLAKYDFEDQWLDFIRLLLNQLLFRPIRTKNKNYHLFTDKIQFTGLQIISYNNFYNIEILSDKLTQEDKRLLFKLTLWRDQPVKKKL